MFYWYYPRSPISILPTTEMLEGFGIEVEQWQHVLDIWWWLSTLWALAQTNGAIYTSVDRVYNNEFQLTHALVWLVSQVLVRCLEHPVRSGYAKNKADELAQILVFHPKIHRSIFWLDRLSAEKRVWELQSRHEEWFWNVKEVVISDREKFFEVFVAYCFSNSSRDVWSRKWLYKMLQFVPWLKNTTLLWDKFTALMGAWMSSTEQRERILNKREKINGINLFFSEKVQQLFDNGDKLSRSENTFIGLNVEHASSDLVSSAHTIFCNFVLNWLDAQSRDTLLKYVAQYISTDAAMCISVPVESEEVSSHLLSQWWETKEAVVYWMWDKQALSKLVQI